MNKLPYPIGFFLQLAIIPLSMLLMFYPFIFFDSFFGMFLFIVLAPIHLLLYSKIYLGFLQWWFPDPYEAVK